MNLAEVKDSAIKAGAQHEFARLSYLAVIDLFEKTYGRTPGLEEQAMIVACLVDGFTAAKAPAE